MDQFLKLWIFLISLSCIRANSIKFGTSSNQDHNENWHGDSLSPSIHYEPTIVSTSDFYLSEILKQLNAINKKIDRAMIRLIGSTVKGDDNDEKARYSNYTDANCESLMNSDLPSGVYNFPKKSHWVWNIFQIYCDQSFGGGWTVIQRRTDNSSHRVNFTGKCWDDYAKGFGDLDGEFWLGNEWIHRLTTLFGPYELRIEFEDFQGRESWAQYSEFTVSSSKDNYRIKIDGYTIGNSTNPPNSSDTKDFKDDDSKNVLLDLDRSCTMSFHGTWWYPDNCIGVNLNDDNYKSTKMMIRWRNNPVDVNNNNGAQ